MEITWICLALPGALIWWGILMAPGRPWGTREALEADPNIQSDVDLRDLTVLIPARNEAEVITKTLRALQSQGQNLRIIVIDDQSTDGTAQAVEATASGSLQLLCGKPLPAGWIGKVWALEQGRQWVQTPLMLLLDADIELHPGMVATLRRKLRAGGYQLVSLMARLRMVTFWERLLLPAFVYFFKLLYPFHWSNSPTSRVAAAAGGCLLLETHALDQSGGFQALQGDLIDDCTLAQRLKSHGFRTWTGLTHSVRSLRCYPTFTSIWDTVTRAAFAQLHYSSLLLLLCTASLGAACWLAPAGLLYPNLWAKIISGSAWGAMVLSYVPILRYYGRSPAWALAMPLIGTLYLGMTWGSALRHWRGVRSQWKARTYAR